MFFIFQIFIYEIFEACAIYKDISVIVLKVYIFMVLYLQNGFYRKISVSSCLIKHEGGEAIGIYFKISTGWR